MVTFVANIEQPCKSGIEPAHNIQPGTECAYISGARAICAECIPHFPEEFNGPPALIAPEPRATPDPKSTEPLCGCDSTADGFSVRPDGIAIHAACGRPRALPRTAPSGASEGAPVPGAPATTGAAPEKPKRGRPAKPHPAPGLDLEKRPGADKWCVVHVASATPLIVGLSAKAKAKESMERLGMMRGVSWTADDFDHDGVREFVQNEQARAMGFPTYSEDIFRDHTADTAGGVPDRPGGSGNTAGSAPGGVPGPVRSAGESGEGAGRNEGQNPGDSPNGIAGPRTDNGNAFGASQAGETGMRPHNPAGPESAGADVPGNSGGVHSSGVGPLGTPLGVVDAAPVPGPTDPAINDGTVAYVADPIAGNLTGQPIGIIGVVGNAGGAPVGIAVGSPGPAPQIGGTALPLPQAVPGQSGALGPAPVTVVDGTKATLAAFAAGAKSPQLAGNTPWAAAYAGQMREMLHRHARQSDRTMQSHLGPSEIGHPCDRNIVWKLGDPTGANSTNHVADPWPSVLGTAQHAWFAEMFTKENRVIGRPRWIAEQKVDPFGTRGGPNDHSGTADLYDADEYAVDDHKVLGETTMAMIRRAEGPPVNYQRQLKLYGMGYRRLGLPVYRVVLIAWPRTAGSLDGLYVWEHILTPEDDEELRWVFERMLRLKGYAAAIAAGQANIMQVPAMPDEHDCYFCPLYRPQSAQDGGPGCPGHAGMNQEAVR